MQVEPFLIEPLRTGDRARVVALLEAAALPVDDLRQQAPVDFLVMREAGQVVGAVGLQSADGHGLLRSLVVASALARQGRGSALVGAAERMAERRGMDDLYLLTLDVPGFFALLDYLRVDRASVPLALQRLPQFASICPSSAVCMHKRLGRARHPE